MITSIPTPPTSDLQIGGFTVHIYALCIITGALLACTLAAYRAKSLKALNSSTQITPSTIWDALLVVLPCGILGARAYYVLTMPQIYLQDPAKILRVWEGGLGIMGGVIFGALAGWAFCTHRKIRFTQFIWCVLPTVPLAQAIGRLGNWFNAELYGKETDLPWGLDISRGLYQAKHLYHPTFAYEMLWNLCVFAALMLIFRKKWYNQLLVIPSYLVLYTFGRIFIESLRIDSSEYILGVRVNLWFAILLLLGSSIWLAYELKKLQRQKVPVQALTGELLINELVPSSEDDRL